MSSNDKNYWSTVKNTLWTADAYSPEILDVIKYLHLGSGMLVGLAATTAMKQTHFAKRYLLPRRHQEKNRLLCTTVNATVGFATKALTSYCLTTETDMDHLTNRIVHAPLMPLQSPSSDLLCGRILEQYRNNQDGMSPNMKKFAHHCQLRRDYEQKLRREQGLDNNEAVSIPYMGVQSDDEGTLDASVVAMKAKYINFAEAEEIGFECTANNREEALLFLHHLWDILKSSAFPSMAAFLLLRRVPSRLSARVGPYLTRLMWQQYTLNPPPSVKHHWLIRSGKLGFDACASIVLGFQIGLACYYWDDSIDRYIVESPLVQGESTHSNGMCQDIVKEYGDRKSIFRESEYQTLRHLSALVHNCQRRQKVEEQLRHSRGLPPDTPVVLPERVSNGITREESDRAWADSLITAQEERTDSPSDSNTSV